MNEAKNNPAPTDSVIDITKAQLIAFGLKAFPIFFHPSEDDMKVGYVYIGIRKELV